MNPTLRHWLITMIQFLSFGESQGYGTKYIIYDAKSSGDRTMFCHKFNVVKKRSSKQGISFIWKAKKGKPANSITMTLSELQTELEPASFSKFILILASERIKKTQVANYWEQESEPITDPTKLAEHIKERLEAHKPPQTPLAAAA